MAADLDFNQLLEQLGRYAQSGTYKALFGTPAPGTREAQELQRQRELKIGQYEVARAQLDSALSQLRNPSAANALLNRNADLALDRSTRGLRETSAIGVDTFGRQRAIEDQSFGLRSEITAAATNQIEAQRAQARLAELEAQARAQKELIGANYAGAGGLVGQLSAAQTGMFDKSIDNRRALAEQFYGLEKSDQAFRQDMARQMLQQQRAANSGVRGFLSNILLPLASAGAGIGALFAG